jgi:hypothetical protein
MYPCDLVAELPNNSGGLAVVASLSAVLQWLEPKEDGEVSAATLLNQLESTREMEDLKVVVVVVLAVSVAGRAVDGKVPLDPPGSGACGEELGTVWRPAYGGATHGC